jgi:hypothetical protein
MGPGALAAVDATLALITLMSKLAEAVTRINAVIETARAEGRDVSAEELATAQAGREAAFAEFEALGVKP